MDDQAMSLKLEESVEEIGTNGDAASDTKPKEPEHTTTFQATEENDSKYSHVEDEETDDIEEAEEHEEEEEEEEEDERQGIYDKPVEVSGKRDRKKVERYVQVEKETVETKGKGVPLGEIEYISHMIAKTKTKDLRNLHRLAFSRMGHSSEVKKNLRRFNGLPFEKGDKQYIAKVKSVEKLTAAELRLILTIFGLDKTGVKQKLVETVLEFLVAPQDHGKKVPKQKRKGRKRTSTGKEGPRRKSKSNATESLSEEEEEESEEESGGESEGKEEEEEEDEEEEEEVKKPRRKTPSKSAKKTPGRKASSAATSRKSKTLKRKKEEEEEEEESSSDSDDEPLAKKIKQPPTNTQIKNLIKKLLQGANLEEVTMKTICKNVYAKYPEFDLTDKKEFIKETVKSIIS